MCVFFSLSLSFFSLFTEIFANVTISLVRVWEVKSVPDTESAFAENVNATMDGRVKIAFARIAPRTALSVLIMKFVPVTALASVINVYVIQLADIREHIANDVV